MTNMMDGTGYSEPSTTRRNLQPPQPQPDPSSGSTMLSTASGIALSGGMIFNALAAGNEDAVDNEKVTLDECVSHPTPFGEYHYHMWSPCIQKGNGWASTTTSPNMCKDDKECYQDPVTFAISKAWTDTQTYG